MHLFGPQSASWCVRDCVMCDTQTTPRTACCAGGEAVRRCAVLDGGGGNSQQGDGEGDGDDKFESSLSSAEHAHPINRSRFHRPFLPFTFTPL